MELDFSMALPSFIVSEVWQDVYVTIIVFFALHIAITVH